MNDWWNDPPEEEELPECCGMEMDFNEQNWDCKCAKCGKVIPAPRDPDPGDYL